MARRRDREALRPGVSTYVHTDERVVALTVDDGPATATPEILRVLRENDARATFFLISTHVAGREAMVNAILGQGHEIGNHMTRDEPSIRSTPSCPRPCSRRHSSWPTSNLAP